MGKSNTTSTDVGDYLPSKQLTMIATIGKALTQRKKEIEAEQLAKAAQRSELLKAILPQFMRGQQAEQQRRWETRFKEAGLGLELAELQQKGELGRANVDARITEIAQQWEIFQGQDLTKRELAQKSADLDIRLKELEVEIVKWRETAANLRTRMTLGTQERISKGEIAGRAGVAEAQITGRETVAGIQRDAAMDRVQALISSDEGMATADRTSRETMAENKLNAQLPAGLKAQSDVLGMQQQVALMMWGAAMENPDLVPAANQVTNVVNTEMARLNTELAKHGGVQYIPIPLPGLGTQKTRWGLPLIGGRKTVPAETPTTIPGLTPTATPAQEIDYWAEQMNAQGATKLNKASRDFLEKQAGVDPDAVERRAKELRK